MTTLRLNGVGEQDLGQSPFDRYGISAPVFVEKDAQSIRISTRVYNTFEEIDLTLGALSTLRQES
jgi:selenocysteine lyase/cysteine desulfurase